MSRDETNFLFWNKIYFIVLPRGVPPPPPCTNKTFPAVAYRLLAQPRVAKHLCEGSSDKLDFAKVKKIFRSISSTNWHKVQWCWRTKLDAKDIVLYHEPNCTQLLYQCKELKALLKLTSDGKMRLGYVNR
jgi:hypothetical protein